MFDSLFGLKGKVNGVLNILSRLHAAQCVNVTLISAIYTIMGSKCQLASYVEVSMRAQDMFGTVALFLIYDNSAAAFLFNQQ